MDKRKKPRQRAQGPHVDALVKAIDHVGSQSELARRLSKFLNRPTPSQQLISKWLYNGAYIDAEYWAAFEHVTDGKVSAPQLRPDVFRRGSGAARAYA